MSLQFLILQKLEKRSQTGYDLSVSLNKKNDLFWTASHQQIYRTLANLTKNGYVNYSEHEQQSKPNKKNYFITDRGKSNFYYWLQGYTSMRITHDPLLVKIFSFDSIDLLYRKNIINSMITDTRKLVEETLYKINNNELSLSEEMALRYKLVQYDAVNTLLKKYSK